MDPDRLAELEDERRFLLRSLRDLDAELAAGDVDAADYETLRDGYTKRAADVLREIEEGKAALPPRRPARWGRKCRHRRGRRRRGARRRHARRPLVRPAPRRRRTGPTPVRPDDTAVVLAQARALIGVDPRGRRASTRRCSRSGPSTPRRWRTPGSCCSTRRPGPATSSREAAVTTAREQLARAVEADPQYADPHCFLAVIARTRGDDATAPAPSGSMLRARPARPTANPGRRGGAGRCRAERASVHGWDYELARRPARPARRGTGAPSRTRPHRRRSSLATVPAAIVRRSPRIGAPAPGGQPRWLRRSASERPRRDHRCPSTSTEAERSSLTGLDGDRHIIGDALVIEPGWTHRTMTVLLLDAAPATCRRRAGSSAGPGRGSPHRSLPGLAPTLRRRLHLAARPPAPTVCCASGIVPGGAAGLLDELAARVERTGGLRPRRPSVVQRLSPPRDLAGVTAEHPRPAELDLAS